MGHPLDVTQILFLICVLHITAAVQVSLFDDVNDDVYAFQPSPPKKSATSSANTSRRARSGYPAPVKEKKTATKQEEEEDAVSDDNDDANDADFVITSKSSKPKSILKSQPAANRSKSNKSGKKSPTSSDMTPAKAKRMIRQAIEREMFEDEANRELIVRGKEIEEIKMHKLVVERVAPDYSD